MIYFIYRIQHMHNPSVQRRKQGNIDVMRCNHLYWKKILQRNRVTSMYRTSICGATWWAWPNVWKREYFGPSKHKQSQGPTCKSVNTWTNYSKPFHKWFPPAQVVLTEFELLPHLCFLFVWDTNTRYCYFLYINLIILELISG